MKLAVCHRDISAGCHARLEERLCQVAYIETTLAAANAGVCRRLTDPIQFEGASARQLKIAEGKRDIFRGRTAHWVVGVRPRQMPTTNYIAFVVLYLTDGPEDE
jgi:hypothetical protein